MRKICVLCEFNKVNTPVLVNGDFIFVCEECEEEIKQKKSLPQITPKPDWLKN